MVNPNKQLWRWGPIDGRPIYPDPWNDGMSINSKSFSPGWPPCLSLYKGDRYSFVCNSGRLYKNAEKIFTKFILVDKALQNSYRQWQNIVKRFATINSRITLNYLKSLNSRELYEVIYSWYKIYSYEFWGIGLLPEIANFGGEARLRKIIKDKVISPVQQITVLEKLSAPERLSFYQQEEKDLLRLRFIKDKRILADRLIKHQQKYYWLFNSYHDTRVLSLGYFVKHLKSFSIQQANHKLQEIANSLHRAKIEKPEIVEKFFLGKETLKVARRLAFCIWWQDKRKSYIFQANHTIDVILRELARRYKVNFDHLHYYTFQEVIQLAQTGIKLPVSQIKQRQSYFTVIWEPNKITRYVFGKKAQKIFNTYQVEHSTQNKRQFNGQAVSVGVARGVVRVILSSKEASKCKVGDILVTTMTSPDFIVAMRKAAAVVTDVGGITSHAAIVSRELKIPCVVGTKIATKVLHDGDLVEVDANKGIIRKL